MPRKLRTHFDNVEVIELNHLSEYPVGSFVTIYNTVLQSGFRFGHKTEFKFLFTLAVKFVVPCLGIGIEAAFTTQAC